MPKLLVLFDACSDDIARLADAVAEGARGVRFAEVDVRRIAPTGASAGADADARARLGSRYRTLESVEALAPYDAIVVGAAQEGEGGGGQALTALLEDSVTNLRNKVASAFTPASGAARRTALWSVLTPMADRGMILVPPPTLSGSGDDDEAARQLGKRVYDITGWITHARSHHHH
jgi:hypothetical protein